MFFVYVLRSLRDGKYYTGSTSDLHRRLQEHNAGRAKSTRNRRPFEVSHVEEFETREEAESREKYLKCGKGREELKEILSNARSPDPAERSI